VTGYATLDKYREISILFGRYIRGEAGLRWDVEAITADDVKDFLEHYIDQGVALRTWKTYAAAIGKLEMALNKYAEKTTSGRTYAFRRVVDDLRPIARAELELDQDTREYEDPVGLITSIEDAFFHVAAAVQHEGGARIREAALIRAGQLLGTGVDGVTARPLGRIFLPSVACKGGRTRVITVSPATYADLSEIISHEREHRIDHDQYRRALKKAAECTGQKYTGSHGLRHNFAQRRLEECRRSGMGEVEAMLRVAAEMGHSRPGITLTYVKRAK
jgi:integrase